MKILVLGGYSSRHIIAALAAMGHSIHEKKLGGNIEGFGFSGVTIDDDFGMTQSIFSLDALEELQKKDERKKWKSAQRKNHWKGSRYE